MAIIYQPQKIYGLTERGKKIQISTFQNSDDNALYTGGKIFHIVDGDNGATYHFFDEWGTELDDIQVGDTPFAYTVSGTPTFDKYYIFKSQAYTSKTWTYKGSDEQWVYTALGTQDGIGKGKTNTTLVMAADGGAYVAYTDTIWNILQSMRDNNVDGCNDWFVPSKAEVEALRLATDRDGNPLTTLFANTYIWSSFENSASHAWYWSYHNQSWNLNSKGSTYALLAVRAF